MVVWVEDPCPKSEKDAIVPPRPQTPISWNVSVSAGWLIGSDRGSGCVGWGLMDVEACLPAFVSTNASSFYSSNTPYLLAGNNTHCRCSRCPHPCIPCLYSNACSSMNRPPLLTYLSGRLHVVWEPTTLCIATVSWLLLSRSWSCVLWCKSLFRRLSIIAFQCVRISAGYVVPYAANVSMNERWCICDQSTDWYASTYMHTYLTFALDISYIEPCRKNARHTPRITIRIGRSQHPFDLWARFLSIHSQIRIIELNWTSFYFGCTVKTIHTYLPRPRVAGR